MLVGLRDQVNVVRRYFRIFRFAECFQVATRAFGELLLQQPSIGVEATGSEKKDAGAEEAEKAEKAEEAEEAEDGPEKPTTSQKSQKSDRHNLHLWLAASSRAFMGMHLFLEVLTLPNTLRVDGLSAWGPATSGHLVLESQRFWFLALACGLGSGLLRLARVAKDVPLPELQMDEAAAHEQPLAVESDMGDNPAALSDAVSKEQARLRRIARAHLNQRRVWRRRLRTQAAVLARRALADSLDLVLPGNTIGWVSVQPATAGAVMLTTTLLTGWDAWVRCGAELQKIS